MITRTQRQHRRRRALVAQLTRAGLTLPPGPEAFNYSLLRAIRRTCYGFTRTAAIALVLLFALDARSAEPNDERHIRELTAAIDAQRAAPQPPPFLALPPSAQRAAAVDRPALDACAWVLWREARGEGREGAEAVASVIDSRRYIKSATLLDVLTRPAAFSYTPPPRWFTDPQSERDVIPAERQAWADCYDIAGELVLGTFKRRFLSTHFYSGPPPPWARDPRAILHTHTVGRHTFLLFRRPDF